MSLFILIFLNIFQLQNIRHVTLQTITDLSQRMKIYTPYFILTIIIQLCTL